MGASCNEYDHFLPRFDGVLGEGTFSVVYLAESKKERDGWVAIKVSENFIIFRK